MKHFKKLLPVTVVALMVTGLLAFTNANKVLLRLNLKKGQQFTYVLGMKQNITQTVGEEQMNINQDIDFIYDMVVDNIDANKNYVIKSTFKAIRLKTNYAGMDVINIDTDKPSPVEKDNPMTMINGMMQGMVGQTFTLVMDNKGQVKEIHGIKELVNNMIEKAELDEETRNAVLQSMETSLNDESIASNFSYAFGFFPEAPVGVGESWSNNAALGASLGGEVKSTYIVKAINGNKVELDIKSNVEPGKEEEGTHMSGKQSGTATVDSKTGLTSMVSLDQDFSGNVEAEGQKMPITIKGTVTMTLVPAK